jgi:thiamine-monophosphate kinase
VDEFELISRFFSRDNTVAGIATGIGDDGAVLRPAPDTDQIQVIDTLIAGVHFPQDTNAADIGYRAVAVNLSDIAAMGARPRWMTLALTLAEFDEQWLSEFARGLFAAGDEFDVSLVGGDTTRGADVTVTVAMSGEVDRGSALLRSGAQSGDTIFVSGTLGDAGAGLALQQRGVADDYLIQRFLRPTPRVGIGRALVGKASAAIDVSDGLLGDLAKLLKASGVGAEIELQNVPLSDALCGHFDSEERLRLALMAGDDYELCFTAKASTVAGVQGITAIGSITDTQALVCRRNGTIVEIEHSGYRHFQ